ncbi:MAG: hypothetical protein KY456_13195 [Chloroflexi bacterium]|nr:hypothetical protein [Chloroflexota bacterium]
MKAVLDDRAHVTTAAAGSAPVFADARRSFAPEIDAVTLQEQVAEVVALLWTDATKVTTFIPLLALRDLWIRPLGDLDARQM